MPFIKHGDGKIVGIVDSDALTDSEKKAVKQVTEQIIKESDEVTDTSKKKKSGS